MGNFILYALSASTQLIFCILIFYASKTDANEAKKRLRTQFYLLAVAIIAWCAGQYAYEISNNLRYQEIVSRFGIIATVWVAFFFALFARRIIGSKDRLLLRIELLLAILATMTGLFFDIVHTSLEAGEVVYEFNAILYSLVTLVPIFSIVNGIYGLERYQRRIEDRTAKKQALYVARGMIATTVLALLGNYVFSLVGVGNTLVANFFVAIAPLVYTVSVGYVVFSLKLFNFRKFFSQVVMYGTALLATLMTLGLVAAQLSLRIKSSFTGTDIFYAILLGGALFVVSGFVVKLVFSGVNKAIASDDINTERDMQNALRATDMSQLVNGVLIVIKNRYGFDKTSLLLIDSKAKRVEAYPKVQKVSTVKLLANYDSVAAKDINEYFANDELLELGIADYGTGFPLSKGSIKGILLVGEKLNGRPLYTDEMNDLAKTANEIALALENTMQYFKIKQFNEELETKIAVATSQLRKSNEKLKALDEAKDEFISMASHQLRTPLTSVKGYLSMLAEGDAGKLNATQKQFIDQAFVSSQRMVYLIADLLNVSRLKTGKFIIESAPTYLPDVVESEIAQLHETVKSRGLTMNFDKPVEFPTLSLDETKIRQVVMNFTDNAIYYTPSGGTIELKLVDTPTSVEFTVTDTGLGVPKSDQPHLFTKFYRAGNARKARPDGTGLGLFMAKKVIVAQGGSLIFKSAENKGSTFGFRFPKEKLLVK